MPRGVGLPKFSRSANRPALDPPRRCAYSALIIILNREPRKTVRRAPYLESGRSVTKRRIALPAAFSLLVLMTACDDDPTGPGAGLTECSTSLTAAQADTFVEVCSVEGSVRHVRIENLQAPPTHAFAQVLFGFEAPPETATEELAADQLRVLFYGGGVPFPPAIAQASFGDVDVGLGANPSFINDGATVCFDIDSGSATSAPALVLWVSGIDGADCQVHSTLTAENAYATVTEWEGAQGAIGEGKVFFRQAILGETPPTVTVWSEPVLD